MTGKYVLLKGQRDLLEKLQKDEDLVANPSMQQGFTDMDLLFTYLEAFGASHSVSFDLSLARGLDYYTGVIYEVVTEGSAPTVQATEENKAKVAKKKGGKGGKNGEDEDRSDDPTVGIGSVAAGGRYDNLVGMFSGKTQVPCVGISFGIDRIFSITQAAQKKKERKNEVDVYVMAFGGGKDFTGLLKERSQICARLWDAGIKVSCNLEARSVNIGLICARPSSFTRSSPNSRTNSRPLRPVVYHLPSFLARYVFITFDYLLCTCLTQAQDELAQGKAKLKEMGLPEDHPLKEGELISLDNLVQEVKARIARKHQLDNIVEQAEGLKVVDGIKGEEVKAAAEAATEAALPAQ